MVYILEKRTDSTEKYKAFLDLVLDFVKDKKNKLYEAFVSIDTNFRKLFDKTDNHEDRLLLQEQALKRCELTHSVDQGIGGLGAFVVMTFDTEEWDNDNMHDAVNPTRITFRTAGWYDIGYNFEVNGSSIPVNSLLSSLIQLTTTGFTGPIAKDSRYFGLGGFTAVAMAVNANRVYRFEQGDYIELYISQNSGVTVDAKHIDRYSVRFWAHMEERRYNRNDIPNRME